MMKFPTSFDDDTNLFLVHDSLRLRLAEDYHPGDTKIVTEGDVAVLAHWPQVGILTLTEQCSDIKVRAISFLYNGMDTSTGIISNLQILSGFTDVVKPKRITNVTINVTAPCHNNLKDALIAIEKFVGQKGTTDTAPFGPTLEGRTNFLRNIALSPKAWFVSDVQVGLVPLTVNFTNLSFRLGTDSTAHAVSVLWDFGDGTTDSFSLPAGDVANNKVTKLYSNPGIYSVSMTVTNVFGTDTVVFPAYVDARIPSPHAAVIKFDGGPGQTVTPGSPTGGPYTVVPRVRSPINTLLSFELPVGENPFTPGYSYAGEPLNNQHQPIDPISTYTWALSDDLSHPNSRNTKASYGVGGIYDLDLRVDTQLGAYRITEYAHSIDIVENVNMWLWLFSDSHNVKSYEFGLISETFKLNSNSSLFVTRDSSFLNNKPNSAQQIKEFNRNTGFAPRSTSPSGSGGATLLCWATGTITIDESLGFQRINISEYTGFTDVYVTRPQMTRPWNWVALASPSSLYFVFGTTGHQPAVNTSPTNNIKTSLNLNSLVTTNVSLTLSNFENGGQELLSNPTLYDGNGNSVYGDFSVCRTAWKDQTGYLARNDGVGPFFRIKSFYRTEGTLGEPVTNIRKLTDVQGVTKTEGQLTNLTNGIYFFNNSGSVSAFSDVSSTWSTGGPGINSVAYLALQDTKVIGFDDPTNTLLVGSDGDTRAYLSFDYSPNAFIKFNEVDTTFKKLGPRPTGQQWILGVY